MSGVFGDSLASKVAGYKGTMADSDSRGSEKPEGSESGLEKLEALFIKMAQDSSAVVERMDKIAQDSVELKQEIGAVAARMDLMREGLQAAVGEARQFTVEHGEKLRQDLSEELREELVEVRQQCEGRTEVVESKVKEVREEVTRLRSSLSARGAGLAVPSQ